MSGPYGNIRKVVRLLSAAMHTSPGGAVQWKPMPGEVVHHRVGLTATRQCQRATGVHHARGTGQDRRVLRRIYGERMARKGVSVSVSVCLFFYHQTEKVSTGRTRHRKNDIRPDMSLCFWLTSLLCVIICLNK